MHVAAVWTSGEVCTYLGYNRSGSGKLMMRRRRRRMEADRLYIPTT
jgi:hypothetical protein